MRDLQIVWQLSLKSLQLAAGSGGDLELQKVIDTNWASLGQVEDATPVLADFERLKVERAGVDADLAEAQNELDKLASGVATLEERQEAFETFMAGCRAGQEETSEGAVTTACVEAYRAGEAAELRDWWSVLAEQVPQGILLLFLLATLSGLYRYNIRLAGFHYSRADALELLVSNVSIKDLTALADALAADNVKIGAAKTPTDHAAEMATALMNRAKPLALRITLNPRAGENLRRPVHRARTGRAGYLIGPVLRGPATVL